MYVGNKNGYIIIFNNVCIIIYIYMQYSYIIQFGIINVITKFLRNNNLFLYVKTNFTH